MPNGCESVLQGIDGDIWWNASEPKSFAPDLCQVVRPKDSSPFEELWTTKLGPWIIQQFRCLFASRSPLGPYPRYTANANVLDNVASALGNTVISSLLGGALVLVYRTSGRMRMGSVFFGANLFILVAMAAISIFNNQQYASVLAT